MTQQPIELDALKKIPLFSTLSKQSITLLQGHIVLESFEAGEYVFTENQKGDKFYIILEGAVKISNHIQGIGEEQLAVHRVGDYFGELAVLDGSPRSANAHITEPTKLIALRKSDLEELMFQDGSFAQELLWVFTKHLAVRLRETNEKLRALHQMTL